MALDFSALTDQQFMVDFFTHEDAMCYGEGAVFKAVQANDHDYGYELNVRFTSEQLDKLDEWITESHASTSDMIEVARESYDTLAYVMTSGA